MKTQKIEHIRMSREKIVKTAPQRPEVWDGKYSFSFEYSKSSVTKSRSKTVPFASATASLSEGVLSNSMPSQAACPPAPPPPNKPKVSISYSPGFELQPLIVKRFHIGKDFFRKIPLEHRKNKWLMVRMEAFCKISSSVPRSPVVLVTSLSSPLGTPSHIRGGVPTLHATMFSVDFSVVLFVVRWLAS